MRKPRAWFRLYPGNQKSSRLSVAAGGVKLCSILLLIAAIPCSLAIVLAGIRIMAVGGLSTTLIFLLDELDEVVFGTFLLWGAFAACRYAACVLQAKAELLAGSGQAAPVAETVQETSTTT